MKLVKGVLFSLVMMLGIGAAYAAATAPAEAPQAGSTADVWCPPLC